MGISREKAKRLPEEEQKINFVGEGSEDADKVGTISTLGSQLQRSQR
jgi:hypothetical protein